GPVEAGEIVDERHVHGGHPRPLAATTASPSATAPLSTTSTSSISSVPHRRRRRADGVPQPASTESPEIDTVPGRVFTCALVSPPLILSPSRTSSKNQSRSLAPKPGPVSA